MVLYYMLKTTARGEISARFFHTLTERSEKNVQTDVTVPNFSAMVAKLKGLNKDVDKAIAQTMRDVKNRAPAQVTKAVTAVYGIKSSEVTAAGKAAKGGAKTVGSIKVSGVSVDSIQLTYKGRVLTPSHFSMTPRKRPEQGKRYTVKAAVFKGKKKVLGSSVFLAPSGASGTTEIPFKRTTEKRLPIQAIRTVSIPQMITNEAVAPDIQKRMDELLTTRLQHYTDRLAQKK